MQPFIKFIIAFLFTAAGLRAQDSEIDRLIAGELKMTFPSIYFRHNSADYAAMPYVVDSCFRYIAANIKKLNSYAIWRDSTEKERMTYFRIKKLRADLKPYLSSGQIRFQSMGPAQKISRRTIEKSTDEMQTQYLLSLNCVLDVSGAIKNEGKEKRQRHRLPRLVWCGWAHGFHWSTPGTRPKKVKGGA